MPGSRRSHCEFPAVLHESTLGSSPETDRHGVSPRSFAPPADRCVEIVSKNGRRVVRKSFPKEQRAAFEREKQALEKARGPGVPESLGSEEDAGRFWLEFTWVGDRDMRMLVGEQGPQSTERVLDLGVQIAGLLAHVHASGLVHVDVKPANFVLSSEGRVSIVDFEHARPIGSDTDLEERFTGGTFGFAPPEAYLGRPPTTSFDSYGLGSTLHYLLTGFLPGRGQDGRYDDALLRRVRPSLAPEIAKLITRLLDHHAERRPDAIQARQILEGCHPPADPSLEVALMSGTPHASAERQKALALREHWSRKLGALLDRIPFTRDELPLAKISVAALKFCRVMNLCMSFVPLQKTARRRLERAQARLPDILAQLPAEVQRLRTEMELQDARHVARLALDLCRIVSVLNLPDRESPAIVQRTGHALQSALKSLDLSEARQRTILARLDDAENRLDLDEARRILTELVESFSGANPKAARLRDRHQHFVWLLERLLAGRVGLDDALATLLDRCPPVDDLRDFFARAEDALPRNGNETAENTESHSSLGMLARIFGELAETHPKLLIGDAAQQLDEVRTRLTARAIELLRQMDKRLKVDPVPVRLLLRDLEETDRILLLDCLVDGAELTRSQILDQLEQLRLRVEEVSDEHRRLARGAREQIDQGRLTTALYDLERALKASAVVEESDAALRDELANVRRRREDISRSTRRNLELADLYARLTEDPSSTLTDRLKCLAQRESALMFLLEVGASSFRPRYERELRELRVTRLSEIAEDAEKRVLETDDPRAQQRIASELLTELTKGDVEPGPRLSPLIKRWEGYYSRAREQCEQRVENARRWIPLVWIGVAIGATAGLVYWLTR